MKKRDKNTIRKVSRMAAITSILTELIQRIQEGQSTAAAKSRNRTFLERAITQLSNKNQAELLVAVKNCPSKDRYEFRRNLSLTMQTCEDLNKKAVDRLSLPSDLAEWLLEEQSQ